MKMEEKTIKITVPRREAELRTGHIRLSVAEQEDGTVWRYIDMSAGTFDGGSFEANMAEFPYIALGIMRAAIDKLEAKLEEDE